MTSQTNESRPQIVSKDTSQSAAGKAPCCSTAELASCCEPSFKESCCGTTTEEQPAPTRCGCR
jgi:hypothetical protein